MMKSKLAAIVTSLVILSGCGSALPTNNDTPRQLVLNIENDKIQSVLSIGKNGTLDIFIKNDTQVAQTVKIQGLKINYVSQSLAPQRIENLHFQLDQNQGVLIVTATDNKNHSQSINVTIN